MRAKVEQTGRWERRIPFLQAAPALIISAAMVLAVALVARSMIIPERPTVVLTGIVSDSICGADHGIRAVGDAECTRACVSLGAQYALMVGKIRVAMKMYVLQGHQADLERFAGKAVTVKGRASGRDRIIVDQVVRSYSEAAKPAD
ncbi:MAG TPA: hypothetical protein VFB23_01500 [Candidatus Acidoferrales bacterium]|nr:hypothetical protein [Candidatus Acidoferrales bacterium]